MLIALMKPIEEINKLLKEEIMVANMPELIRQLSTETKPAESGSGTLKNAEIPETAETAGKSHSEALGNHDDATDDSAGRDSGQPPLVALDK